MTDETKIEDLKLSEQPDGSAIVGDDAPLKDEAPATDDTPNDDAPLKAEGETDDDEPGHDEETAEEAEERRERNRARRRENKERRKDYIDSLKREIAARDEVLQNALQRLDAVERRSHGADIAMVDSELQKTSEAYNYYKAAHADAVTRADGAAAADAQEKMFNAMRRAEQLSSIKENAKRPQQQTQPLDPRLKVHAEEWMGKNRWYDPNGADPDSEVALTLDRQLAREGWNPTTPQYWQELDSRVKKYLPHRHNSGYNPAQGTPGTKPRAPVAGSGRDNGANSSSGGYKLSAERVQALKDSGMWEDPKQRAEAVKRYQEYDKQAKENGNG